MVNRSVVFKAERVSEDEWQIVCHCPGDQIEYVTGFPNELATEKWLQDQRREYWLKARDFQF